MGAGDSHLGCFGGVFRGVTLENPSVAKVALMMMRPRGSARLLLGPGFVCFGCGLGQPSPATLITAAVLPAATPFQGVAPLRGHQRGRPHPSALHRLGRAGAAGRPGAQGGGCCEPDRGAPSAQGVGGCFTSAGPVCCCASGGAPFLHPLNFLPSKSPRGTQTVSATMRTVSRCFFGPTGKQFLGQDGTGGCPWLGSCAEA